MQLEWMCGQIENTSYSWYGIYDNNALINVWQLDSLINPTSNREEFYFSRYDIHCMMNCFGNNVLTPLNMQN